MDGHHGFWFGLVFPLRPDCLNCKCNGNFVSFLKVRVKKKKTKLTVGDVTQWAESLPSMHDAQGSFPVPRKPSGKTGLSL